MKKFSTKYFGELEIDEGSEFEYIDLTYNNDAMYLSFSGFNGEAEKTAQCIAIIDRYAELHEIAKKEIAENYESNEVIRYYFKYHFETLDKETLNELFGVSDFSSFSIEKAAEKLCAPDLEFLLESGEICISADYRVSKEYSEEVLCVKMNEDLFVMDFTREN